MNRTVRSWWHWSWVVTAPIAAVFVHWLLLTTTLWHRLAVERSDAAPSLHQLGIDTWQHLRRGAALALDGQNKDAVRKDQRLRTIQLFAAESSLARLDRTPGSSDTVDAVLLCQGGGKPVKLRYGDGGPSMWAFPKRTWQVKTKATDLFEGMRSFQLAAPQSAAQANRHLTSRLASTLGLITPRSELVSVFLNGKNQGVHELIEQLEEGTLRRHDRMPGDLFAGRGARLFERPQEWQKLAENNHYPPGSRAALERLCQLLAGSPSEAAQAQLSSLLDMAAWGRFGALELLAGTTFGAEDGPWFLFWDPWQLRLQPVVAEASGWLRPTTEPRLASRLHAWLAGNGDFLAARQAALEDLFGGGGWLRFETEVEHTLTALDHALAQDPNLRPTDPKVVAASVAGLRAAIREQAEQVQQDRLGPTEAVQWCRIDATTLRLRVAGPQPVTALVLHYDRPLPATARTSLHYRRHDDSIDIDLSGGVAVQDQQLRVPARLFGQFELDLPAQRNGEGKGAVMVPSAGIYELLVTDLPLAARLLDVEIRRGNRHERATEHDDLPAGSAGAVFCVTTSQPRLAPRVWRDVVDLASTTTITDDLVIEPGTTIRLHEGASLLCSGRVTALGTAAAPIRFGPASPGQDPWGTLRLDGAGCDGSRFRWCEVRGGSGYKVPLAECCSMVAVHNTTGVRFEDCTFTENHRYDDMIHVVYSEVGFERVTLAAARMDALDCDLSRIVVRDSAFVRSGNDAVDLMTTKAMVVNCRFEANGDKGISIGEDSRLFALQNRFVGCGKAMEAKDGSIGFAANCEIRGCKVAGNAYKKNWRYDAGGSLVVLQSAVIDNDGLPTADKWSRAELRDCRITGELADEFDQEYIDGTRSRMKNAARLFDADAALVPKHRTNQPFPPELHGLEDLAAATWQTIRWDVRGVADGR